MLCITSISESRLLDELGLPRVEQNQILGLQVRRAAAIISGGVWLTGQQLSNRAIVRLATNPPLEVGKMQRYTSRRLVRAAIGSHAFSMITRNAKALRSMPPLAAPPVPARASSVGQKYVAVAVLVKWLTERCVRHRRSNPRPHDSSRHCILSAESLLNGRLNMSNNDLATQLHHALFNTSPGYVLKPAMMLQGLPIAEMDRDVSSTRRSGDDTTGKMKDAYWPAPCMKLHVATLTLLSLHNLPKVSPPEYSKAK